jgi:hypothetical protein
MDFHGFGASGCLLVGGGWRSAGCGRGTGSQQHSASNSSTGSSQKLASRNYSCWFGLVHWFPPHDEILLWS